MPLLAGAQQGHGNVAVRMIPGPKTDDVVGGCRQEVTGFLQKHGFTIVNETDSKVILVVVLAETYASGDTGGGSSYQLWEKWVPTVMMYLDGVDEHRKETVVWLPMLFTPGPYEMRKLCGQAVVAYFSSAH